MKHFCGKCGATNLYQYSPPIYCGYCGQKFNLINKNKEEDILDAEVREEDEINSDHGEKIIFKKIKPKFELTTYNQQASTLDSLIGLKSEGLVNSKNEMDCVRTDAINQQTVSRTKEDILNEFRSEASTDRHNQA
jgi:uncharacterized Zn finger protein (UPF0148 family)